MLPHPTWLIALFCGLFLASASAQRPKPSEVGVAPPQPVQLTVKVQRGGKTEIPFRIHGKANEPLKFLIRTPPVQGKISDPRSTGRETAVAVYEPPADLTVLTDRFFYAVQGAAGVSAPVEVAITIIDQPPQLGIPDTLDFPSQRSGAVSTRLLEISNRGGGLAEGEVIVEAPWRIDGKTAYRLGAGDIAVFKLVFAPAAGGTFEGVARYTSDAAHSTTLKGSAESAVAVHPAEIILGHTVGDPVRTGTLELTNQTDEARSLEFKTDPRLQMPPQINLPARGKVSVPIQTAPTDVREIKTEIRVVSTDLELRVPVKGAPPGPIVRPLQPAVDFGRIPVSRLSRTRFELQNIGGSTAEITWTISAPFRASQNSVLLVPGEKRGFDLEIESKTAGRFRAWLQCKIGDQGFEIPVDAEVSGTAPGSAGAPMRPPAASTGATTAAGEATSTGTKDGEAPVGESMPFIPQNLVIPEDWLADKNPPGGVKVTETTATTATLQWPAILSPSTRYRVELKQYSFTAEHKLTVSWLELGGLEIRRQGEYFVTTIRDLQPAQPWVIRVVAVKPDGSADGRLFTIAFKTPPKISLVPRVSPLSGLLTVLVGLVAWKVVSWWRQRR